MAQITYADKVAINQNAGIADINKVNASDMNEIKTVVNGLLSSSYSTDSTLGYNTTYINNRIQLLWSNDSPTSSMAADTKINLANSNYDLILWIFCYNTSNTNLQNATVCTKGNGALLSMIGYSAGALQRRQLTYVSDTQYNLSDGRTSASGTSTTALNIPLYAYGIKL